MCHHGKDAQGLPGQLCDTEGRVRRLTPRECARLQGFEDSFVIPVSDCQAYKQFGNAVTVNVSKAIAQSVKDTLKELGEWVDDNGV